MQGIPLSVRAKFRPLGLIAGCALPILAQAGALPADLARAAAEYDQAQIAGDGKALQRLLADDYTLVNSRAEVSDKAGLIRDYTDPDYRLDLYTVREPVEKVWRDGAVLGGTVALSGTDHGKRFSTQIRFADIWARRRGQWQVIFTQVTKVPTPP